MPLKIAPQESALLVVDIQQRLFTAMPELIRGTALKHVENLLFLARALDIPVLASEQYPRGLGPTLPELSIPDAVEKLTFSAVQQPDLGNAVVALGRKTVILVGMETHVCVAQTARDLSADGFTVVVPADAVLSRRKLDWRLGLSRIQADGGHLVTTEAVLFEWLEEAGTPLFKQVSQRIR